MDGLKDFNSKIINSLPVSAKVVDNFPKANYWDGSILYEYKKLYVGVNLSHHTTGSRISYIDYSGSLKYDQIVTSNSFGPIMKLNIKTNSKLKFYPYIGLNIINTKYRLDEELIVSNQHSSKSTDLDATSLLFNLGIETVYSFNWVGFGFYAGYSKNNQGKLYLDNEEAVLEDGDKVYTDWTGFRYGLSIFFEFDLKNCRKNNTIISE